MAFSRIMWAIVLVSASAALFLEMKSTGCGASGGRLKNWLSVFFCSGILHLTCSTAVHLLKNFWVEQDCVITASFFRGVGEINNGLLLMWFTLGNLWVLQNTMCANKIPGTFYVTLVTIIIADIRCIVPVIFRATIIMCPTTSLVCLRQFFGAAGVMLDRIEGDGVLPTGRPNGHGVDDGAPPSDAEIVEWVCWLADRGCVVEDIKDVIMFVSPERRAALDSASESKGGAADEIGDSGFDDAATTKPTPTDSSESDANAAPSAAIVALEAADTAFSVANAAVRAVADIAASVISTITAADSGVERGATDTENFADIFDERGSLRPHVALKKGFEKAGSSLTQCLICICEYTEDEELSVQARAAVELTSQPSSHMYAASASDERRYVIGEEDGIEESAIELERVGIDLEAENDERNSPPSTPTPTTPAPCEGMASTLRASGDGGVVYVVPFPCASRHIFHEACLHGWLVSCGRSRKSPTCPFCRESEVTGATSDAEEPITMRDALRMV